LGLLTSGAAGEFPARAHPDAFIKTFHNQVDVFETGRRRPTSETDVFIAFFFPVLNSGSEFIMPVRRNTNH
jgi:hypothetical protein